MVMSEELPMLLEDSQTRISVSNFEGICGLDIKYPSPKKVYAKSNHIVIIVVAFEKGAVKLSRLNDFTCLNQDSKTPPFSA